jgi:hypothetical protein
LSGLKAVSLKVIGVHFQGDDEPQWPTPEITTSESAAILAMNGAPFA